MLTGVDVAQRIDQLKALRDSSPDLAFRAAFDETLGNKTNTIKDFYDTVFQSLREGLGLSLEISSLLNNLFNNSSIEIFKGVKLDRAVSAALFGAQELLQVYNYADNTQMSWLDSQLSCHLRNVLQEKIRTISQSMNGEPQPLEKYDTLKTLRTIYYFLGYRDVETHKKITGTYNEDMSVGVWLGTLLGTWANDNSHLDRWEGNYLQLLNSTVKTQQFMDSILALSTQDTDGDGKHDREDKFPADAAYWEDTDDDGLPDDWERSVAGNLTSLDGTGDRDDDGISDAEEFVLGTNPLVKSTRTKVNDARVGTYTDLNDGTVKTRVTWTPLQIAGLTYRVYRLAGGAMTLIGTNISEYAFVDDRNEPSDVYYVVVFTAEGMEGPRVEARRKDYLTNGLTPQDLEPLNAVASPGGHVQLYGIITDPDTGFLVEEGEIIIYGTTGTFTGSISDGRVRMIVTAPSSSTGDDPWSVILKTDGKTVHLPKLSITVASGNPVTSLRTSNAVGTVAVSFSLPAGYPYAKVEAGVPGALTIVQDGSATSYTATQFSPGQLIEFQVSSYRLVTDEFGDQVRDYGTTVAIKDRVGWGGQLLDDAVILWPEGDDKFPHKICSTLTVPVGLSLTIDPGAWIQFASQKALVVAGTLSADGGSAQSSIYLTSANGKAAAGDWGYIHFMDGSTGNMRHVVVEYAGYQYTVSDNGLVFSQIGAAVYAWGGSVALDQVTVRHIHNPVMYQTVDRTAYGIWASYSPSLTISNCVIEDVESYGIYNGSSGVVKITDSNISDCGSWGIVTGSGGRVEVVGNTIAGSGGGINTSHPTAVITGNDLVGNGNDNANYVSGTIAVDRTWENNVRFHQVTVAPGARLTIQPRREMFWTRYLFQGAHFKKVGQTMFATLVEKTNSFNVFHRPAL